MAIILGIRTKHDAAAALIIDGQIIAAAAEERFTKIKHHYGFPENSIKEVLAIAGIKPNQVDYIARDGISIKKSIFRLVRNLFFTWTPRLYKEVFSQAVDRYIYHIADSLANEDKKLKELGFKSKMFFVEHHFAHAAYALYTSGEKDATVVVLDGRGHYIGGSCYQARSGKLELISEIASQDGSLGLFYSAVTDALGFTVGDGEGKTMGLACYGDPTSAINDLERFTPKVFRNTTLRNREWNIHTGVIRNRLYAHYEESAALRILIHKHGKENVAAGAQKLLETRILDLINNIVHRTGRRNLVAAGGVFLNVKASKFLLDQGIVDSIYIPPAPGDDGLPAGYALAANMVFDPSHPPSKLRSAYLGPSYDEKLILTTLKNTKDISWKKLVNVPQITARLIAKGKVVGWFQGKMEWGPRALGNRSVLADPRNPGMRDRINNLLKKRDWFMPFAPSVLKEYCNDIFIKYQSSPFMNLAFKVKPKYVDKIPAVIHIDKTARPQEVDQVINPLFYATIREFQKLTDIPLVLNTSFNMHGLPIVCNPKDAIDHLKWGCVDVLIIGDYLVERSGKVSKRLLDNNHSK